MTELDGNFVTNIDRSSGALRKAAERLLKKRLNHVNALGRAFIAAFAFSDSRHRK